MTRIALLFLVFALVGCGNKGPLMMASSAPAADPPATPADAPVAEPPIEDEPVPADPVPSTSGTPAR